MIANGVVMSKMVYLINLCGGAQQYLLKYSNWQLLGQSVASSAMAGLRRSCSTGWTGSQLDSWSTSTLCYRPTRQSELDSQGLYSTPSPLIILETPEVLHMVSLGLMKHSLQDQLSSTELCTGTTVSQLVWKKEVMQWWKGSWELGSRSMCHWIGVRGIVIGFYLFIGLGLEGLLSGQ